MKQLCKRLIKLSNDLCHEQRRLFFNKSTTCYAICEYIKLSYNGETILVIGDSQEKWKTFYWIFKAVVSNNYQEIDITLSDHNSRRMYIKYGDNHVNIKYMSPASIAKMHPIDAGVNAKHSPFFVSDYIPKEYYQDYITVETLENLGKYF